MSEYKVDPSTGNVIDCDDFSNYFQSVCWNPLAPTVVPSTGTGSPAATAAGTPAATSTGNACGITDVLFGNCPGCSVSDVLSGACMSTPTVSSGAAGWALVAGFGVLAVLLLIGMKR